MPESTNAVASTAHARAVGRRLATKTDDGSALPPDAAWMQPEIVGVARLRAITVPSVGAFLVIAALAVIAVGAPSAGMPITAVEQASAQAALYVGAATLAVLCATVFGLYARLGASTAAAWVASALAIYGLLAIGITALWPLIERSMPINAAVMWLQPGARAAVIALMFLALWTSRTEQAWRRRPTRVLLISVAITGAATVLLQLVPSAGLPFTSATDVVRVAAPAATPLVLPAVWLGLAIAYLVAATRRHQPMLTWVALACLALSGTEAARISAVTGGLPGSVGAEVLHIAGLVCGLVGVVRSISTTVHAQRSDLLTRVEVAEAVVDDTLRLQSEQVHEARNTLSGIVNTLRMVEEGHLDAAAQRQAMSATFTELLRLQHLFAPTDGPGANTTYFLTDTLAPLITAARASGMHVTANLNSQQTAWGSWAATAQAVQNLLENARRHAPGSRVEISIASSGNDVLLKVADFGPGVRRSERDQIFESGARGTDATNRPGSGLGLAISRDLVERQQGRLWVEDTPGGGATFVIALPTQPPQGATTIFETSATTAVTGETADEVASLPQTEVSS